MGRGVLTMGFVSLTTILLAACGGGSGGESAGAADVKLQGAGASFPAPLYNKWFKAYSAAHQNVLVDYQSVGSGSGVKSVMDRTVDFGASDAAMKPEDMAKVEGGVQLLPMTAGSIVLAYKLDGVDGLQLSRQAYTGIFLGKVKRWNDPLIAKANPGAKLPDLPINVVVRADSSGTSFVFSKHLSADQPGVREGRRRQHDAQLARRHQVQGQRGRHGQHHDDARIDRLHRIRLREESENAVRVIGEQVGEVRRRQHSVRPGGARLGHAA